MNKPFLNITYCLVCLITIGCGTMVNSVGSSPTTEFNNKVEISLDREVGQSVMMFDDILFEVRGEHDGENIQVIMNLTNTSEKTKELLFSSGQQYDVVIKDEEGNILYHYAEGKMFTMALVLKSLRPNDTLTFENVWVTEDITEGMIIKIEAMIPLYSIDGKEVEKGTFSQSFVLEVDKPNVN